MNEPVQTAGPESSEPGITPRSNLFVGPDGLRPFWALLIYIAILAAPVLLFLLAAHFALGMQPQAKPAATSHELPPVPALVGEWMEFAFVFFASWVMSRIEHRSVFDYGLSPIPQRWRRFGIGAVLGVAFQALLILVLWSTHHLVFAGFLLHPATAIGAGLLWAVTFLGVALFEEFLFRGYLQFNLTRCFAGLIRAISPSSRNADAIGFWIAAILISFGFGLVHRTNAGESPIGLLCAAIAALVFAYSLWRTGSLWWAIGLHAGWDWAQSYLFGVADSGGVSAYRLLSTHPAGSVLMSGGLTGPEGSVFVLPVMVLITISAILTLPRRDASLLLWNNTRIQLPGQVNSAHE